MLLRRDCIVELFASSSRPLSVLPAREATGASFTVLMIANCALVVDDPPIAKS